MWFNQMVIGDGKATGFAISPLAEKKYAQPSISTFLTHRRIDDIVVLAEEHLRFDA